jgi:hypothetical protein
MKSLSGDLVEQRFARLSSELDLTRDARKRLSLNRAGPNENPFVRARRPSAKRPQSSPAKALRGPRVEEAIVTLLQSSPGLGTGAFARATAAQSRRQTSG